MRNLLKKIFVQKYLPKKS